jgi:hypothetical protein
MTGRITKIDTESSLFIKEKDTDETLDLDFKTRC